MSPSFHDSDAIQRYVTGQLPTAELDAFEEHLLGCGACRAAVRTGVAIRRAAKTSVGTAEAANTASSASIASETGTADGPARARVARPWLRRATMAAAAGLALWAVVPGRHADPLGAAVAPAFEPSPVRAPIDSTAALVDRAMSAYAASDFRTAAELLERAARADSSAGVAFYLGVALLLDGREAAAAAALRRAFQDASSPYADEARYYAAKAYVRAGQVDSARALLRDAATEKPSAGKLRAFADSLARP